MEETGCQSKTTDSDELEIANKNTETEIELLNENTTMKYIANVNTQIVNHNQFNNENVQVFTLSGDQCIDVSSILSFPGSSESIKDRELKDLLRSWGQEHFYPNLKGMFIDAILYYHITFQLLKT